MVSKDYNFFVLINDLAKSRIGYYKVTKFVSKSFYFF